MSSTATPPVQYKLEDDGVLHCNIYTRGKTTLGRMMSNLADSHIDHPRYGHFRTLEGLWYFLKTGKSDEFFRVLNGYDSRNRGKPLNSVWNQDFQREFKVGIICKILANPLLSQGLKDSELPFTHYYFYGKEGNVKIVAPKGHEWQLEFWESMRTHLKEDRDLVVIRDALLNFDTSTK